MGNRIENELQLEITKNWIKKFQASVDGVTKQIEEAADHNDRFMWILVRDGYQSQLDDLKGQVVEYEHSKTVGEGSSPGA